MPFVALVAASAALVLAEPTVAHQEVPGVTNVLDSVEPELPAGVTIQVQRSVADQLVAENAGDVALEVLGEESEAFLRIGPEGVEADVASPEWHRSNSPDGLITLPEGVSATAEPQWVRVSPDPSWGWFDHRLHEAPVTREPTVGPGEDLVLDRWEIPMRVGETPILVRGRRIFSRPAGRFHHVIESPIPGMQVSVLEGNVPAIFLTAPGQSDVELLGADGEPFARFGAEGAEVNDASPTWALTARRDGEFDASGPVGAGVKPRWRRVNPSPQLIWLEPRAVPPVEGRDHEWSVPARWQGRSVALQGRSEWIADPEPPSQKSSFAPALIRAAVAGVVVFLFLLARRRRGERAPQDGHR